MIPCVSSSSSRARLARFSALTAAAAAVIIGSLAVAAPASAHDQLISSDPAADSSVDTLPDELVLVYNAQLLEVGDGTAVEVAAPSGASANVGDPVVDDTEVRVPLAEGTEAGEYTVTWRVVSSDGHPIDGTFAFTVENAAAPAPDPSETPSETPEQNTDATPTEEPATPTETAAPTPDASADADPAPSTLPWILGGLATVLAIGAVAAAVIVKARRGAPGRNGVDEPGPDDTSDDQDAPSGR